MSNRRVTLPFTRLIRAAAIGSIVLSLINLSGCKRSEIRSEQASEVTETAKRKPNIVIFYVDDLGYGDLSSYGATNVQTPNIDALANQGIKYTDAHSPAATCTPSRYSMLTGQYAFRNNAAILPGDAPLIIDPNIETLPKMLKRAGYTTGVVGKWHLGLGRGKVDWNKDVKPGPLEIGFDYSFLLPATGDRVPTVYLENHNVVNLDPNDPITVSYEENISDRPVGTEYPELLKQGADLQHSGTIVNGISRIGWMSGGKSAEWVDEEFPDVFTQKAIDFIADNKSKPFMLFFPFNDIHVPRVPNQRFVGTTGMGPRGDAIAQMDWMTGRIIDSLKEQGLFDNTLIIFSSDNGPVLDDGYFDKAVELIGDHNPAGPFAGGKYSAYEAGTRVPMITYLAGVTNSGESDALMTHLDFYASLAALVGVDISPDEAIDSRNVLPALLDAEADGRPEMIQEAFTIGFRQGQWKYIAPFTGNTPDWLANKTVRTAIQDTPQLFDLSEDIGETTNLADVYPQRVANMANRLAQIKAGEKRVDNDVFSQPNIGSEASRYGDIDVTRPEIQIPESVEPLFEHWLRDTYVNLGHDGYYYMTGTVGMPGKVTAYDRSPGVKLWRSRDLKDWESMGVVWDFDKHGTWQKDFLITDGKRKVDLNNNPISDKQRTLWAPEIHYIESQQNYFIVATIPRNPKGGGSFILRSTTGEAAGPYENIAGNDDGFLFPRIDGSLFEDDDGTVYFIGHNHEVAKMKPDMSGFAEQPRILDEQEYARKPYIEGAYIFKDEGKYHLVQAIWSFRKPDGTFAYDVGEPNDPTRVYKNRKDWAANRYSYDVVIATADNIYGPYSQRYTSVIGAGHNNLFKDKMGQWWATMFGNPRGDLLKRKFLTRPAIIPMRKVGDKFYPDFAGARQAEYEK